MPRRRKAVDQQTPDSFLRDQLTELQKQLNILRQAKMSSVQPVDTVNFNDPYEGMTAIDWPTSRFAFYHDNKWIYFPSPVHAIKVFPDTRLNKTGSGVFRFAIEPDLDNYWIWQVSAFNGTKGTSNTVVQLSLANDDDTRGTDILSTPITILGNNHTSHEGGVQPVINMARAQVHVDDMIWINADSVGAGSKGLGVYIMFIPGFVDNSI